MSSLRAAIVIPARYGSSRLPGKPLAIIAGKTMLQRVVDIARKSVESYPQAQLYVTTDDKRIANHAHELDVQVLMTPPECPSGTDRVAHAVRQLDEKPDFIINFQGDAPLTPPDFLHSMLESYLHAPCDVITPVTRLNWSELDALRVSKQQTPFSGTTAVFEPSTGRALWFSKQIIPAIRKEADLRESEPYSPVYRHIGLYGYAYPMLQTYSGLNESYYETLEGLEQLRILEQGYHMRCVPVSYNGRANMSGVDSVEDIARAEALIARHGELVA